MASDFSRNLLKVAVAQICQNIGWHAVQTSPMEVLVDIAHRYLLELSKITHQYSNQYNRSEPNIMDLGLAFRLMGVQMHELEEYVNNVEPVPFAHQVAAYPLPHDSNFQFPKPKSRSVAQRPDWIHEYLPLTHPEPEGEEEPTPRTPEPDEGAKTFEVPHSPSSSSSEDLDLNSNPLSGVKRTNDGSIDQPALKRAKLAFEDEGRPMRELVSIFMTPSGLISPAREGKLPDPRMPPKIIESSPEIPIIRSPSSSSSASVQPLDISAPKPMKLVKKDKSKMLKFKKDMTLKKHIKKMKIPKNKSPSHNRFPMDSSPPALVKKEANIFNDPSRIKKKKRSMDNSPKMSKMKPAINKIRIAKDKSFRTGGKDAGPSLPIKLPKVKHRIKSPSHSSISYPRSPKSPKGHKFHVAKPPGLKIPKTLFPAEKPHLPQQPLPPPLPPPVHKPPPPVHKPPPPEIHEPIMPVKIEPLRALIEDDEDDEDEQSREDTPEPRLVIDDEAQARREKENRMADLDECINAVIKRGQSEMENENKESDKNVDDAISFVIQSSKKLEPRDVYDFTDSSDGGDSLPKTPKTPEPQISSPPPKIKKEKTKSPEVVTKALTPENPKKKKEKAGKISKKKPVKEKPKPALSFPKFGRSGLQEKRAPSPPLDDSDSSDIVESLPSPGPSTPKQDSPVNRSNFNPFPNPFNNNLFNKFPGMGFPPSPFSPLRPLPSNPFPTPPLFVTPKMEMPAGGGQTQPINLALTNSGGSSSSKNTQERKHNPNEGTSKKSSSKGDDEVDKPSKSNKEHKKKPEKKEKVKKKEKEKEKEKVKEKVKEKSKKFIPPSPPSPPPVPITPPPPPPPPPVVIPEPKKLPPLEKKPPKPTKTKPEKKTKPPKVEKEKPSKKIKEEKKVKEDSSAVPKITLKLGSNAPHSSGSTKIVIKTSGKDSRSCSPAKEPSPEPPPSPPPLPPPPPPPPPSRIKSPVLVTAPPPPVRGAAVAASSASSGGRGRQGGRGRGAAKRAASPTPCIVTTETLGTIMDESGNKIWICPACTRPDDGSPMIGCDECDDWYHWVCVGIVVPPKEEESWFCSRCISKRQSSGNKKRRKKHKKDK